MFMDFPVNGLSGSYKTCNPKRLLGCTDASSALEPALSGICGFEVSGVEEADGSASRARFLRNIIMYWFGLSNWEHTIRDESFYELVLRVAIREITGSNLLIGIFRNSMKRKIICRSSSIFFRPWQDSPSGLTSPV